MSEQMAPTLEALLHEMWGDAKGGSTYNKAKWMQLQALIATERAAREAAEKKADYLANALQGSAYQAKDVMELVQRAETAERELAELKAKK